MIAENNESMKSFTFRLKQRAEQAKKEALAEKQRADAMEEELRRLKAELNK